MSAKVAELRAKFASLKAAGEISSEIKRRVWQGNLGQQQHQFVICIRELNLNLNLE